MAARTTKRILNRTYVRDDRDDDYVLEAKASKRKLRRWPVGAILDQLDTPSCVGHAWSGFLLAPNPKLPVNPHGLYTLCQYRDEFEGQDYDGTSVRAGADVLKLQGFLSIYEWARDIEAVIYALLELGPVVIGSEWTTNMDRGGMMRPTGQVMGGHAYRMTAIDLRDSTIEITNSWGRRWSQDGRAKMAIEDFAALMQRDCEVCVPRKRVPTMEAP